MTPLEKLPERLITIVRMFKRAYWYNLLYYTCTDIDRVLYQQLLKVLPFSIRIYLRVSGKAYSTLHSRDTIGLIGPHIESMMIRTAISFLAHLRQTRIG